MPKTGPARAQVSGTVPDARAKISYKDDAFFVYILAFGPERLSIESVIRSHAGAALVSQTTRRVHRCMGGSRFAGRISTHVSSFQPLYGLEFSHLQKTESILGAPVARCSFASDHNSCKVRKSNLKDYIIYMQRRGFGCVEDPAKYFGRAGGPGGARWPGRTRWPCSWFASVYVTRYNLTITRYSVFKYQT